MSGTVYVIAGEPGVGKSTVAELIIDKTDGIRLSTDKIRKELFGPDPDYTSDESQATYDELFSRTENLLSVGRVAVLDATFMFEGGRDRAREIAVSTGSDCHMIQVTCDDDIVRERIRQRDGDESDADVSIYESISDRFEPLTGEHTVIDNSGSKIETEEQVSQKLF